MTDVDKLKSKLVHRQLQLKAVIEEHGHNVDNLSDYKRDLLEQIATWPITWVTSGNKP